VTTVRGPYFDELHIGQVFDTAPAVTLTEGLAAAHHAIVGNRLRLALDHDLSRQVSGEGALVTPALVWDLSIGQSTAATQKVRANLFYRNLRFHRFPRIADTLHTVTTVDALRANRPHPDRPRTGMAALHIVTTDQSGRTVLDYWRCAMLPVSPGFEGSLAEDDLDAVGTSGSEPAPESSIEGWDLPHFRTKVAGLRFGDLSVGQTWSIDGPDVVTSAPELARLTGNVAAVHHDATRAGGRRLVYGGHTVGLALHHVTRAIPSLVAVLGWQSCDHLAPVHEGDALTSTVEVTAIRALDAQAGIADLRVVTSVQGSGKDVAVLDWRLSVVLP
jgi:acyl dehydratase